MLITGDIHDVCPVRGWLSDLVDIAQVRPDSVAQTFRAAFFDLFANLEVMEVFHCLVVGSARFGINEALGVVRRVMYIYIYKRVCMCRRRCVEVCKQAKVAGCLS